MPSKRSLMSLALVLMKKIMTLEAQNEGCEFARMVRIRIREKYGSAHVRSVFLIEYWEPT